jgi:hypothetical protein
MVAITPQLRSVKSFACFSLSVAIGQASSYRVLVRQTSGADEGSNARTANLGSGSHRSEASCGRTERSHLDRDKDGIACEKA